MIFADLLQRLPRTREIYGDRQTDGTCSRCQTKGTVLGTTVCEDCYAQIIGKGLRAPKATNEANRLAYDAKRIAWKVWAEGVVNLRELEGSDDALHAAALRRWIIEVDDDARPGPVEPSGLPTSSRAAALVRWLRVLGRTATYEEASDAMGCTRQKLGAAIAHAEKAGELTANRGTPATLTYGKTADEPAQETRPAPEQRAQAFAQIVRDRPGIGQHDAARALGVSVKTAQRAATFAVDRGWVLLFRGGWGSGGYHPATPDAIPT